MPSGQDVKPNRKGGQNVEVGNMIASPNLQLFDDNTELLLEANNKV